MTIVSNSGRSLLLVLILGGLAPSQTLAAEPGGAVDSTAAPSEAAEPAPDEVLATAREDLAKGRVKEADETLKALLGREPDNAQALSLMADLDLLLYRGALAEPNLRKAVAAGLPSDQAQARLAEAFLQQGQPKKALDLVTVPQDDPALAAEVLAVLARARFLLGDRARAKQLLDRALTLAPNSLPALTAKGTLALAEGDRGQAREVLGPVAARDSGYQALAILAEMDQQDGHLEQAERGYTAALQVAPDRWPYRYNRALVRIDLGWLAPAKEDLAAVQALMPGFVGLPVAYAGLDLAEGDPDEALDKLIAHLAKVPQDQAAFALAARAAAKARDPERLYRLAQTLHRQVPGAPGPALIAAEALLNAGEAQAAQDALRPVEGMADSNPAVALFLARVQAAAGRADDAQHTLDQARARFPDNPALQIKAAQRAIEDGAPGEALSTADALLAKDPGNAGARALRGLALLGLKRPQEALKEGTALMTSDPGEGAGYRIAAAANLALDNREAARQVLARALERTPAKADLALGLAELEASLGDREGAAGHYRQALKLDPNNIAALSGLARFDGTGGDALARLQQNLERNPNNADLRGRLIADLLDLGRAREAEALADATPATLIQDGPAALARARAVAYLEAKRPADAVNILQPLASAAPESAPAQYLLARAYAAQGDARARDAFLEAWLHEPDTPLAEVALGQVLATMPNDEGRETFAKNLQRLQPKSKLPYALRATLAAGRGDTKAAADLWRDLHDRDPDNPKVVAAYLRALLAADRIDEAKKLADAWLAGHAEDWGVNRLMGDYLAGKGRLDAAVPYYQRAVVLQPDNLNALNNLAFCLTKTDPAAAGRYAERALTLAPDQAQVMDTAGTIRLANGDTDGAVQILTRAHQAAPSAPDIALHLAQALAAAGQVQPAIELLRPIVSVRFDGQSEAKALLARLEGRARAR